jgi:polynucleotide 5'-kinase involved in rRNA processing
LTTSDPAAAAPFYGSSLAGRFESMPIGLGSYRVVKLGETDAWRHSGHAAARQAHPIPPDRVSRVAAGQRAARRDRARHRAHQVVIVCGETGSGKTTQLPKIALQLGRGLGAGGAA